MNLDVSFSENPLEGILSGQILRFQANDRGGFYVLMGPPPDKIRYRADRSLFDHEPPMGSVLLFEPGSNPPSKNSLWKVKRVLFANEDPAVCSETG